MAYGSILDRAFYARPCSDVARDLVGVLVCHRRPDGVRLAGRIVETEAYLGEGRDPASHAHNGPTPRNASMFGPPGRLYVYRSYGVHLCMNLVCEEEGAGAAVLLRAIEPLEGVAEMRANRGLRANQPGKLIASGPGRLTQALGIGIEHDGASVLRGAVVVRALRRGRRVPADLPIDASPRIGISKAVERPLRFVEQGSPWLSRRR